MIECVNGGTPMNCIYCNALIPDGRLEFLMETNRSLVCIECSSENRAIGFMDWGHKTAPSLVMVPSNATETIRKLNRANRRAR
jgi:hypothetical protein